MDIEQKILQGITLTEKEVKDIIYKEYKNIQVIEENGDEDLDRWTRPVEVIFQYKDNFYSLYYQQGLTEYQENEYPAQEAVQVYPTTRVQRVWTTSPKNNSEMVNHPDHYNQPGKKECIVEMEEKFGTEAVYSFCVCNAFKYEYRAGEKTDNLKEQDLKKAAWYTDYAAKLIDKMSVNKVEKEIFKNSIVPENYSFEVGV